MTMKAHGTPWKIGKQYQNPELPKTCGNTAAYSGNYPVSHWWCQRSAGYGWLTYAPKSNTWSTFYGGSQGIHYGMAMHTYYDNATQYKESDEYYKCYLEWKYKLPADQIESRPEFYGPTDKPRR